MIEDPALICSIISMVSTFFSAIFFAPSLIRKDEEITEMCATCFDGNPVMKKALMKDRRNAQIGLCLLSIGVEFQIFSIYFK